ncbi:NAD(P)-dependent dehydrogenase (short-subunit alcohol dehydrogenase family) [Litoreibacter ponti]|uniref:NAD(P)-dependent dehydrogenase (Short-subunit alcohol dehydrogenase family) n=1 Tax=Litoreibacter ponti TaxID=1510457 RepID=A0A2T6BK65_9RHOB|nr:SDR family oxidoreductase [Litoreibacter ponti]PTX56460.1 NAD(P)-dependent dehydrogenase (short-subunit alcohol dehydrogenase family) [Litoreibacter ponti]
MTLPRTPSMRLDGKRAFVPGGSRGIGLGCAVALAEAGAEVVIAARSADQVAQSVAEMTEAGLNASGFALDVTDLDAVTAGMDAHGPFDILCNSAGLARHSAASDTSVADFDAVTGINIKAAYFLAQKAAAQMRSRGGGSIIQISSQMGHVGGQDRAVYCATKHAVEGFNKAMAIEWGPDNIRVNSICPTFIKTPLTEPTFADPEKRAWIDAKIKLPRIGLVEDIMGATLFLASDASAMVTGTSILVDGGWTAG